MRDEITNLIMMLLTEASHPKCTTEDVRNITQAVVNLCQSLNLLHNS